MYLSPPVASYLSSLSVQLYPDGDFSQDMDLDGWARSFQPENATTEEQSPSASPSVDDTPSYPFLPVPETSENNSDESEVDSTDDIHSGLRRLSIHPNPRRYFGKSSGISLLRRAMTVKPKAPSEESTGFEPKVRPLRRHEFWSLHPVSFLLTFLMSTQSIFLVGT